MKFISLNCFCCIRNY